MPSVSNGLYFLTLPLVSVICVIYRKIRHARYLYIKRNVEKVWVARYTLGERYLSKNTVNIFNARRSTGTLFRRLPWEGPSGASEVASVHQKLNSQHIYCAFFAFSSNKNGTHIQSGAEIVKHFKILFNVFLR